MTLADNKAKCKDLKKDEYVTSSIRNFNTNLNTYLEPTNALFLNEWVNNCKCSHRNNKNILILHGTGNNGKTTIIRNIELTIGKKKVLRRHIKDNTLIPPEYNLVILCYQPGDDLSQLSYLFKYNVDFIIETNDKLNIPMDCIEYVKVINMKYTFKDGVSVDAYA